MVVVRGKKDDEKEEEEEEGKEEKRNIGVCSHLIVFHCTGLPCPSSSSSLGWKKRRLGLVVVLYLGS